MRPPQKHKMKARKDECRRTILETADGRGEAGRGAETNPDRQTGMKTNGSEVKRTAAMAWSGIAARNAMRKVASVSVDVAAATALGGLSKSGVCLPTAVPIAQEPGGKFRAELTGLCSTVCV